MSDKEKSEKKVANSSKSAADNKETEELKVTSKKPIPVEDKVDKAEKKVEKVEKELEKVEDKKEKSENESGTPEVNPAKQLKKKKEIIRVLRELVNGVENKDTFNNVKDLQNAWKDIGNLNNSKDKSLWTTYNALLDRFMIIEVFTLS